MMSKENAEAFIADSEYKKTVYHGTKGASADSIASTGFDPTKMEQGHWFGDGTYFTPNYSKADMWAWQMDSTNPTVLFSKVRLKKAFVMEDWPGLPDDIVRHIKGAPSVRPRFNAEAIQSWLDKHDDMASLFKKVAAETGEFDRVEETLTRTLKDMGYDGTVMKTTDPSSPWGSVLVGGEEVMVFDPRNIATFEMRDIGFG